MFGLASEVLSYYTIGGSLPMLECLIFDMLCSTNSERLY